MVLIPSTNSKIGLPRWNIVATNAARAVDNYDLAEMLAHVRPDIRAAMSVR